MNGLFTFLLLAFFFFLGYLLYRNSKKKNKKMFSEKSKNTGSNKTEDWVFNKDINEENVPKVLLSYRKQLNGYTSEKINTLYGDFVTKGIAHETQKNLAILGLTEAVIELERQNNLKFGIAPLSGAIFDLLLELPVNGANGQIENIEGIINYFNELKDLKSNVKKAWAELDARNEIIKEIRANGFIYQKDLKKISKFSAIEEQTYLINRMAGNSFPPLKNVIERDKKGKYVIFRLPSKQ